MWLRARGTREFCICSAPKLQGLHLTQHMVVLSILQDSSLGLSVLLTQSQGMPGSRQVTTPNYILSSVGARIGSCVSGNTLSLPSVVLPSWTETPHFTHCGQLGGSWWRDSRSTFMCFTYQSATSTKEGWG